MIKIRSFLILFPISIVISLRAVASTFYIAPTEGVGISKDDLQVTNVLISSAVSSLDGHSASTDLAKSDFVLKAQLLKLGESYLLVLQKLSRNQDRALYSSKLKIDDISELDKAAPRIVRSVITERTLDASEQVGETLTSEKNGEHTKQPKTSGYAGFGPSIAHGLKSSDILVGLGIGINWHVESQTHLRAFWEGANAAGSESSSSFHDFGLGVLKFFSTERQSPYILGDLGYGIATRENKNADEKIQGFILGAGVGYRLFRTSKVQFDSNLSYRFMLKSGQDGNPGSVALKIGICLGLD